MDKTIEYEDKVGRGYDPQKLAEAIAEPDEKENVWTTFDYQLEKFEDSVMELFNKMKGVLE